MKKKKNNSENYLELIPTIADGFEWKVDEAGIVTISKENKGVFSFIARKIFGRPRVSYVHLDELGSFVWPLIDGKTDIMHLGEKVKEQFGEKAEPLYPRLAKYFMLLERCGFVRMEKSKDNNV